MHASIALNTRNKISDYLDGVCSLDDLRDWIAGAAWSVERTGTQDDIDVVYEVVHALALFDDERDMDHLRAMLLPLVTSYSERFVLGREGVAREVTIVTGSSADVVSPPIRFQPALVGR